MNDVDKSYLGNIALQLDFLVDRLQEEKLPLASDACRLAGGLVREAIIRASGGWDDKKVEAYLEALAEEAE